MTSGGRIAGTENEAQAAAFFADFPVVVLVANSEAVEIEALRRRYGEAALYVFFNKVYKVLARPFDGPSLLVARSGPAGANIVYRREVGEVTKFLDGPSFAGILNLRSGPREVFSPAEAFGRADVGHLDLGPNVQGFYPPSHVPTSGFALALFLSERCPSSRVVLAGFTAKRSAKWRLFDDHDWNFEQVVLRLLFRRGRLETATAPSGAEAGALARIAERLDGVSTGEVSLVAAEVLAERLDNANSAIDELVRLTRLQGRLRGWLQGLKPTTRKERAAAKDEERRS